MEGLDATAGGNGGRTVEVDGSGKAPLPGARRVRDVDDTAPVDLTVVVRRRNALDASAPPPLGQPATKEDRQRLRSEFADRFGADQADLDAVRQVLEGAGMRGVTEDRAARTVKAEATAAQVRATFGVSLGHYEAAGISYRGREGAVQVPARLEGIVEAVLGLDDRPQARAHYRRADAIAEADLPSPSTEAHRLLGEAAEAHKRSRAQPLWATHVAQLYSFPTGVDGTGETIAIIELGGGYRDSELATYFTRAGVKAPGVTAVAVGSGKNAPGVDPNADGEVLLDIEVAGSVAPGAEIVVYFAGNTDQGFLDAITTAVHDATHAPSIVSISWGGPEDAWTKQSLKAFDSAFADAAAMGVTVLCAAGDHGAWDGAQDAKVHTDFPASSPNVVACGGTTLIGTVGTIVSETVWNDGDGWATGGGISDVFPVPAWQKGLSMPPNKNSGGAGRGLPDIAGNADITTGYITLCDGKWSPVGGTSAVAPLYAGLAALLNQGAGKSVGPLSPKLYSIFAGKGKAVFRDVSAGDNSVPAANGRPAVSGYNAAAGWDACTGLGSVNGSALLASL